MAAWRLSPQAPPACVNFKLIGDLPAQSARGVWILGVEQGLDVMRQRWRCIARVAAWRTTRQ